MLGGSINRAMKYNLTSVSIFTDILEEMGDVSFTEHTINPKKNNFQNRGFIKHTFTERKGNSEVKICYDQAEVVT